MFDVFKQFHIVMSHIVMPNTVVLP